ncbi:lisH domain-containing protein C1711.05-like [Vicia villosa]|uniref:lisH domain-containing protein C1711.05-like n=1 Tax=Vicia villosa TaxID=3911 RepID=UPI00273AFBD0|nr:lisH domain-containing protein C1711.05-like [Vicia villosa]
MEEAQNLTEPPKKDAVSEQQAAETGDRLQKDDVAVNGGGEKTENQSPKMISSTTDQNDDEETKLMSSNKEPFQTETSSKKGKQVAGDVSMNDSSTMLLPLPLDSKKTKDGPETKTTSAETPTRIRTGQSPGSGTKKRNDRQSQTTSEETSSEKNFNSSCSCRAEKMNNSSTTDHQKDGDDDVAMNEDSSAESISSSPDVAMNEDGGEAEIISSSPDVATNNDVESLVSGSRSRERFNKKEVNEFNSSTTDHQKDGDDDDVEMKEDGGAAEIFSSSPDVAMNEDGAAEIISSPPDVAISDLESLSSSFSNLLNIKVKPCQTQTQASGSRSRGRFNKKKVAETGSRSALPLESNLCLTPKKRKGRPCETQRTSAETPTKKRKDRDANRRRSF